ncbi:glycosyltransferase family 21 protein [Stereum hirsutum FP-91666 SS1]|uniref:glycosyltransferase family 21 protein n=1 Tax=Stereum hirsutum (strain FP-91666) TaxID=721885 RepID=UPI000440F26A|nr:glycosyltransferase family 21 protein [Stereum hirsutum FP-91666 SS1]EIM92580.1 glycosyltransferase family 21 protein [Stereum hirsutum FP-91666 SS1]
MAVDEIGGEHRITAPLVLSIAGTVWYAVIWGMGLVGCIAARKRYRLRPRSPTSTAPASSAPGVSILRPLRGLDTNLYENLESAFLQEYNNYEIILSVADENDQALPVVRDLLAKYPNVNARVIIGDENVGINPKVNNLIRPYREAKHDILWVLDSNVTVAPGTLARAVDILHPPSPSPTPSRRRIALVHHVPFAFAHQPTLGSRIEEAFLNTNHAKMYIAINTLAVDSCVMGKSNLYRRSDLERVDGTLKPISKTVDDGQPHTRGLLAFGRFLAEDNMIAGALWHELDLRHDLSCDVAHNAIGNMTLSDYVWRRVRWIRVRKHMTLAATMTEPLTETFMLSIIASASFRYLFGIPPWLFLPLHYVAWIFVDLDVYASLAGYPLPSSKRWPFLAAWAARELMAFPIWLTAVVGNEVEWRGRKYQVLANGQVARSSGGGGLFGWLRVGRGRPEADAYEPLAQSDD